MLGYEVRGPVITEGLAGVPKTPRKLGGDFVCKEQFAEFS